MYSPVDHTCSYSAILFLSLFCLAFTSISADNEVHGIIVTHPMVTNYGHTVEVNIRQQTFRLILDTGSNHLSDHYSRSWSLTDLMFSWVYGNSNARDREGYNADPGRETPGLTFDAQYGDGDMDASGDVYDDDITVGGIAAMDQLIGVKVLDDTPETRLSMIMDQQGLDYDGVLGIGGIFSGGMSQTTPKEYLRTASYLKLAFKRLINRVLHRKVTPFHISQTNFFGTVLPTLLNPVFALSLNRFRKGFCAFGYIPLPYRSSALQWAPVVSAECGQAWVIRGSAWAPGPGSPHSRLTHSIAIDAGASHILMPQNMIEEYLAHLEASSGGTVNWRPQGEEHGAYLFDCATELNDMAFYFARSWWIVDRESLRGHPSRQVEDPVTGSTYKFLLLFCFHPTMLLATQLTLFFLDKVRWCEMRIRDSGYIATAESITLGLPFFYSTFVVFEHPENGNSRIGFAPKMANEHRPRTK